MKLANDEPSFEAKNERGIDMPRSKILSSSKGILQYSKPFCELTCQNNNHVECGGLAAAFERPDLVGTGIKYMQKRAAEKTDYEQPSTHLMISEHCPGKNILKP